MQENIVTLLVLFTLVRVWAIELPTMLGFEPIPYKPFNCATCLSWWVGVAATILLQDWIFLTLYIINDLYDRRNY